MPTSAAWGKTSLISTVWVNKSIGRATFTKTSFRSKIKCELQKISLYKLWSSFLSLFTQSSINSTKGFWKSSVEEKIGANRSHIFRARVVRDRLGLNWKSRWRLQQQNNWIIVVRTMTSQRRWSQRFIEMLEKDEIFSRLGASNFYLCLSSIPPPLPNVLHQKCGDSRHYRFLVMMCDASL